MAKRCWPSARLALLLLSAADAASAQRVADLVAAATPLGEWPAFGNAYVNVHYELFAYPPPEPKGDDPRPVVLYVEVAPGPGLANTRLLVPPPGARPVWRPAVVPRAVHIELVAPPPTPPDPGEPGTDPPRDAAVEREWNGGRLLIATFHPFDYGVGTGRHASVTTFLSDGVVEIWNRGVRRRMGVQAGDAFWFDPATRITVLDDYPVGAAIVQLLPRR
jgi:hypothetical protein